MKFYFLTVAGLFYFLSSYRDVRRKWGALPLDMVPKKRKILRWDL